MSKITIVDARMGRGKSSAAIRYMNEYQGQKRFLYITPYLDEVERICQCCGFEQPENEQTSKSTALKRLLRQKKSISTTHTLFSLMDRETLELVADGGYSLIVDESIQTFEKVDASYSDVVLMKEVLVDVGPDGRVHWKDEEYKGVLSGYRCLANSGMLWNLDSAMFKIMNPAFFTKFDEVYMLTYQFDGQPLKPYLELFGLDYNVVGIEVDDDGYRFSNEPDKPNPIDYRELIHIWESDTKIRSSLSDARVRAGVAKNSLSLSWFMKHDYSCPEIRVLRQDMKRFFTKACDGGERTRLWTCYKDHASKLIDKRTGRYKNNFLQISARATNEYRDCTDIAYIANRYIDPNITKFFAKRGIKIDGDLFARSEMLQWIWRSAIRDNKPINLYIPSKRMRTLLEKWIDEQKQGGQAN